MVRVPLEKINKIKGHLPENIPLWLDPGIDGYEHFLCRRGPWSSWAAYIGQFRENKLLATEGSVTNPDKQKLKSFVHSVLDKCLKWNPILITIPQLPITDGSGRNKTNRLLASAANEWKVKTGFAGRLILPIIFTHQEQTRIKTKWMPKLQAAWKCCTAAEASDVWIVDSSLRDQEGSGKLASRFTALVRLHEDMRRLFHNEKVVAGPYWGMNLVLWSRGLCDNPAINLGTGYQYRLSGDFAGRRGKIRIALPPLRRWAVAGAELRSWFDAALKCLNLRYEAYGRLVALKDNFSALLTAESSRNQIAGFYKMWFDKIEQTPEKVRAHILYEDLSLAYVLGKQLPPLPKSEAPGRDPSIVAQQLMLNCL